MAKFVSPKNYTSLREKARILVATLSPSERPASVYVLLHVDGPGEYKAAYPQPGDVNEDLLDEVLIEKAKQLGATWIYKKASTP